LEKTHISGYKIVTSFSRTIHKWGGVVIYIKDNNNLKLDIINTEPYCQECDIEMAVINLKSKKQNLTLIGIYRSPNTTTDTFYKNLDAFLQSQKNLKDIIIMGDANFNILDKSNQNIIDLTNFLQSYQIQILDIPYTRIAKTSITSIDGCYTNIAKNRLKATVQKFLKSDHHSIICEYTTFINKPTTIYKRKIRIASQKNLENLRKSLENENWSEIYKLKTVDEKYDRFVKTIQFYMDVHMPKVTKTYNSSTKPADRFWNEDLLTMKQQLTTLHDNYLRTGQELDKEAYLRLKRTYDLELTSQKATSIENRINNAQNKRKEVWNIINQEQNKNPKTKEDITLLINNKLNSNPYHIGNHLNKFFTHSGKYKTKNNNKHTTKKTETPPQPQKTIILNP